MEANLAVIIGLILLALAFDFMNGFHDAANSIATVVSTRVLKPHQAVFLAAVFNFLAIAIFQLKVAASIGKGLVLPESIDVLVIFSALIGAITWNIITWFYGLPSSSSHALIGGLVGAVFAKSGWSALLLPGLAKVFLFIIISPILGFFLGAASMLAVSWLCFRISPMRVDRCFRRLQLLSAALYSLGHGGNDAQKTIGIIWMLLLAYAYADPAQAVPPTWVIFICYFAMSLGTLFGGWRIVKTMGQKITKLKPVGGFCAESGGAVTLFIASFLGIPVSTTHTITGAIVGVGSTVTRVRWAVVKNIVLAWITTIPTASVIAAGSWYIGAYCITYFR